MARQDNIPVFPVVPGVINTIVITNVYLTAVRAAGHVQHGILGYETRIDIRGACINRAHYEKYGTENRHPQNDAQYEFFCRFHAFSFSVFRFVECL